MSKNFMKNADRVFLERDDEGNTPVIGKGKNRGRVAVGDVARERAVRNTLTELGKGNSCEGDKKAQQKEFAERIFEDCKREIGIIRVPKISSSEMEKKSIPLEEKIANLALEIINSKEVREKALIVNGEFKISAPNGRTRGHEADNTISISKKADRVVDKKKEVYRIYISFELDNDRNDWDRHFGIIECFPTEMLGREYLIGDIDKVYKARNTGTLSTGSFEDYLQAEVMLNIVKRRLGIEKKIEVAKEVFERMQPDEIFNLQKKIIEDCKQTILNRRFPKHGRRGAETATNRRLADTVDEIAKSPLGQRMMEVLNPKLMGQDKSRYECVLHLQEENFSIEFERIHFPPADGKGEVYAIRGRICPNGHAVLAPFWGWSTGMLGRKYKLDDVAGSVVTVEDRLQGNNNQAVKIVGAVIGIIKANMESVTRIRPPSYGARK